MSEQIYDNEISPLVAQIIAICAEHKMGLFMDFEYSRGEFCRSARRREGNSIVFRYYDVLAQCKEADGGVNIDKFMFAVMKEAREHGHESVVLSLLEIPTKPEAQPQDSD